MEMECLWLLGISFAYSTDGISWVGNCVNVGGHYKYGVRYHEDLEQFYAIDYYDRI